MVYITLTKGLKLVLALITSLCLISLIFGASKISLSVSEGNNGNHLRLKENNKQGASVSVDKGRSDIINTINNAEIGTHANKDKNSSILVDFSQLTIWSSDFHISPVADIKQLVSQFGVSVIDKSLSGHCHLTNTCQRDLHVLTSENGISLGNCPNQLISEFYSYYRADKEMASISAILCTHAMSMCEVFMPFDKPLIAIASTRFEIGRHSKLRWQDWVLNLIRIASKPNNVVAANNYYDLEYIKYFTNLTNVLYLPSYCGYIVDRYNPVRKEILIAPSRGVNVRILQQLTSAVHQFNKKLKYNNNKISDNNNNNNINNQDNKHSFNTSSHTMTAHPLLPLVLSPIRELYPSHYEYSQLASHPAIVILPYQVSFMSFFEFYRMGIPMFVPSPALLTAWHVQHAVLNERSWPAVFGKPAMRSVLQKHEQSVSHMKSDPNNEFDEKAILEWILLSDFYIFPHVTQFDSFEQLFQLLLSSDLKKISQQMHQHNVQEKKSILSKWQMILSGFEKVNKNNNDNNNNYRSNRHSNANEALKALYDVEFSNDCTGYKYSGLSVEP